MPQGPSGALHTRKDQLGQTSVSLFLQQHIIDYNTINTLPDIVFTINGSEYPVPARAYLHPGGEGPTLVAGSQIRDSQVTLGCGWKRPPGGQTEPLQTLPNTRGWAGTSYKTSILTAKGTHHPRSSHPVLARC